MQFDFSVIQNFPWLSPLTAGLLLQVIRWWVPRVAFEIYHFNEAGDGKQGFRLRIINVGGATIKPSDFFDKIVLSTKCGKIISVKLCAQSNKSMNVPPLDCDGLNVGKVEIDYKPTHPGDWAEYFVLIIGEPQPKEQMPLLGQLRGL